MSDEPEGFYVNENGEPLVEFTPENIVGTGIKRVNRRNSKRVRRLRNYLLEMYGNTCHYCDKEMKQPDDGHRDDDTMTLEHIVPRSMGGGNTKINCVLACYKCNSEMDDEYIKCECEVCEYARIIFEKEGRPTCYRSQSPNWTEPSIAVE